MVKQTLGTTSRNGRRHREKMGEMKTEENFKGEKERKDEDQYECGSIMAPHSGPSQVLRLRKKIPHLRPTGTELGVIALWTCGAQRPLKTLSQPLSPRSAGDVSFYAVFKMSYAGQAYHKISRYIDSFNIQLHLLCTYCE